MLCILVSPFFKKQEATQEEERDFHSSANQV